MARKPAKPRMSDEDRRFIYRALKKNFDFDEDYPLASLGWCFVREGINREDYGFLKLKPMLEEMSDFVSMSAKEIGGVSQSMFCLHEFEEYENDLPVEKESSEASVEAAGNAKDSHGSGAIGGKDGENDEDADSAVAAEEAGGNRGAGEVEKTSGTRRARGARAAERTDGEGPVDEGSESNGVSSRRKDAKKENASESNSEIEKNASIQKDTNNQKDIDEKDASLNAQKDVTSKKKADIKKQSDDKKKADVKEESDIQKASKRENKSESKNKLEENSKEDIQKKSKCKNKSNNQIDTESEQAEKEAHDTAKREFEPDEAESGAPAKSSVRRSAKSGSATSAKPGRASEKHENGQDVAQRRRQPKAALPGRMAAAQLPAPASPRADARRSRRRVIPGKALERFGYLGIWKEFLSTLADLALDEPWDFSDAGLDANTRRFDILHNYIRYTFYRLTLEDKVGFSSDEDFAVFNTGLVDKHYEDIYACFEPSDPDKAEQARYPWAFSGFCTAGTGRLGKRLVRELNPLPQPASYLERKEDLLFDLDREVVCDVHHIVVDNVHRLPVNFLRDELASSQECLGILAGVEELSDGARAERFERLRDVIEGDTRLFNRLSTSINAAIDVAKRQVRWNYKTAVPAYYPRTNSMNLLLPLILTDSPAPDVALVVELQKSGNYQGQTIVTMAQAYRDARLLCRPYIDWLSPASIIDAADEEDEEE